MLDDLRKPEGERTELIVEPLKNEKGYYTGYLHKGELVRCKECKWYKLYDNSSHIAVYDCYRADGMIGVTENDFCSYGVRITNTTAEEKPTPIRDYMVHGERKEP